MAATPDGIDVSRMLSIAFGSSPSIFSWGGVICVGDGGSIQPLVTLGVAVAKVEHGGRHMKSGGRIPEYGIRKISCRRAGSHCPRANIFSAHVSSLGPDKLVAGTGDARPLVYVFGCITPAFTVQ